MIFFSTGCRADKPGDHPPTIWRTVMSNVKDKLSDAAGAVADKAKDVGHKIAEGAAHAVDYVKEKAGMGKQECGPAKSVSDIQPHMDVIASCGCKMGKVDHLEGGAIKLTKNDSPDGIHHFIPTNWVARVDEHVHLNKDAAETKSGWKADAVGLLSS
jgi:hypothetical protein